MTKKEKRSRYHCLTNIDKSNRTAICSKCGPVKIYNKGNGKWRCGNHANALSKKYHRQNSTERKAHIEQQRVERKHNKLLDYCQRCNFIPEDKCQLDQHHVRGKKSKKCITLCANCHRLITKWERKFGKAHTNFELLEAIRSKSRKGKRGSGSVARF